MDLYYYLDKKGEEQGPVPANELTRYGVTYNTKVWKQGMDDWKPASSVPELYDFYPQGDLKEVAEILLKEPTEVPIIPPPYKTPQKPDNWLVLSILATLFCCVPTGIVSVIYSTKVNGLWDTKDYFGAFQAANNAKIWFFASLGLGILWFIIVLFLELYYGIIDILLH